MQSLPCNILHNKKIEFDFNLLIHHLQDFVVIVVLVKHTLKTTLCVNWTDRLRTLDDYAWVAIRNLKNKTISKNYVKIIGSYHIYSIVYIHVTSTLPWFHSCSCYYN